MNMCFMRLFFAVWLFAASSCFLSHVSAADLPSPVNQVFQYSFSAECTAWSDGSKNSSSVYLWIPENCNKLRGLLILCANVPEHKLVGHSLIREVCAANDLGIVWGASSFMNWSKQQPGQKKMSEEYTTTVAFLQQLLDGLAKNSGYGEVATVPWLPMGESGHLLMVDTLMEAMPQRCIAGVFIKNNHLPPKNRQTPTLVVYGTAQEWGQDKADIRTNWNNIGKAYDGILAQRKSNPKWPLSYVIDGHSGHFDCSERLTKYFARYIDLIVRARLSEDGSPTLKEIDLSKGFVADLPVPGHEGQPIKPAAGSEALPWYLDEEQAKEAQAYAAINWKAENQLLAYLDDQGQSLPFNFNGITDIKSLKMEEDGITFSLKGTLLDEIPAGFVGAGEKLLKAPGEPEVEWQCGSIEPIGGGKFRVAQNRVRGPSYVVLRHAGTDTIRGVVQPARIEMLQLKNTEGKAQAISFDKIPDVKAGVESVPLVAKSDSGLSVQFYVEAGPAIAKDGKLTFTKIPPRSKFPVLVTVCAWQWGRGVEPKFKTAEVVKQTFKINP